MREYKDQDKVGIPTSPHHMRLLRLRGGVVVNRDTVIILAVRVGGLCSGIPDSRQLFSALATNQEASGTHRAVSLDIDSIPRGDCARGCCYNCGARQFYLRGEGIEVMMKGGCSLCRTDGTSVSVALTKALTVGN
jgi:hypothetical protein